MYQNTYLPQYQYQYQQRQDYMPAMQQPAQQNNNGFSIRPVSSRAEAEASQIAFDGTPHFFYNTSCGEVYAKTFNANNGTAPLVTFYREKEAAQQLPQYVTVEEFKALKEEIERLKRPSRKGGVSNDPD